MITFFACILALIGGYMLYGKFVEKFFGASSSNVTPVKRMADNVDYKELKPWRIYIIQFLNIAGLGPIFGAILGAAYGPMAYLWIVLGCIFIGAAHDYFSGMLSIRNDGKSLPELVGRYLGKWPKKILVFFTAFLLVGVGVAFVTGPADLMSILTGMNKMYWLYIIFLYYILATLLPIDKIIGAIYPYFGITLLFMAFSIAVALVVNGLNGSIHMTELTLSSFRNFHSNPETNILFPMMFVVISCGAISGFHATQSPMMARCMTDEKYGRPCFYGAMISEGIVALIWATAAINYFGGPEGLNAAAAAGKTPAIMVNEICNTWLGKFGAAIAIIGVVICPITSGDTAFRGLRLLIADAINYKQGPIKNRLMISVPIFVLAYILCKVDFSTIWKFVGIGNQTLAAIVLWTASAYLVSKNKPHWMMSLPATFITYICASYFVSAPHSVGGLALNINTAHIIAALVTLIVIMIFYISIVKKSQQKAYEY